MKSNGWDWTVASSALHHRERIALMREIPYETTQPVEIEVEESLNLHRGLEEQGKALSVNISSGGMLLLMDRAPEVDQVLRVYVPTAVNRASIPTLAEVRWVREVPFPECNGLYFVGVKFIL